MSSPTEPLRVLRQRMEELAASLGLEQQQFVIVPADPSHGLVDDIVQVVFTLNDELIAALTNPVDAEQAEIDATFEALMANDEKETQRAMEREREEEKMAEAGEAALRLRQRLTDGKDILDD